MQIHAVQHLASGGAETKAHVRQTEGGVRTRNLSLNAANGIESGHAVFTQVFVAGANGEGECVENEVAVRQAVALGGDLGDAMSNAHLPLNVASLSFFVDEQTNNCGAVIARESEHAVESATRLFAIFQVCRVQDAATTGMQKACFHYLWFGGVEHQRHACLRCESRCNFVHVDNTVVTHVVNTNVKHV